MNRIKVKLEIEVDSVLIRLDREDAQDLISMLHHYQGLKVNVDSPIGKLQQKAAWFRDRLNETIQVDLTTKMEEAR
jgi:hypothetical protein